MTDELANQIAKLINDTVDDLESCWKENDQLREQLAAAVEALRKLRNGEHDRYCPPPGIVEVIDAALAKIGEK